MSGYRLPLPPFALSFMGQGARDLVAALEFVLDPPAGHEVRLRLWGGETGWGAVVQLVKPNPAADDWEVVAFGAGGPARDRLAVLARAVDSLRWAWRDRAAGDG